ncbi:uncharacterized protein PV09_08294 [Verruconis gallopava]|uniref:separase n=1 Tax=Verruconis gallopava TaxID=253628 RepID=A0A0D2ALW2_9PEZI|nr:uncharacterized protein PV09_08294 [Verruconis gallopava]KIW00109.1 hypothetical protein PV09_08294 [Verruconis gallopava]
MAQLVPVDRSILQSLDDPTSCTNDIILSIKSLLSIDKLEHYGQHIKEDVKAQRGHTRAKSVLATTKVTAASRGTKGHNRQLTVVEIKQEVGLNPQEKVNLAFHVVNACIKALSRLAKEHVLAKRAAQTKENSAKSKGVAKGNPPDTALRTKSPNPRQLRARDEVCKPKKTASPAWIIAACACTALSFLRAHYTVRDGKDSTYQVENGILAVVGKCVDLELADMALDQLRALKDRLTERSSGRSQEKQVMNHNAIDYVELINLDVKFEDMTLIAFAVKLQQHAWQILNLVTDVSIISTTLEAVLDNTSNEGCFGLLRKWAMLPGNETKGSRQLSIMSRLLLQLSTVSGLSSMHTLVLRCSAFTLQLQASRLVGGISDDEATDVAAKLGRCLESFRRSSDCAPKTKHTLANTKVMPLISTLQEYPACESELAAVCHALSQIEVLATNTAQSVKQSGAMPGSEISAINAIRLAVNALNSDDRDKLLEQAANALQQTLPTEKTSADRLLIEVVSLRRAIHKAVTDKNVSGHMGLHVAACCLVFLRNYLGCSTNDVEPDAETKERNRVGKKFIKSFINTIILCCLQCNTPGLEVFSILDDCCNFFSDICATDASFAEERLNSELRRESSIFVTISKLCHRIWNQRTAAHGSCDDIAIIALKTSIKSLERWTREEKEAGSYFQELRYLIEAHLSRGDLNDAFHVFQRFVRECDSSGILEELVKSATRESPAQLRNQVPYGTLVFRCIRSFIAIATKLDLDETEISHSQLNLAAESRGLLLEWQLEHFANYATHQRSLSSNYGRLVRFTFEHLLKIYDQQIFPVKRARVAIVAARLYSVVQDLCDPNDLLSRCVAQTLPRKFASDCQLTNHYSCLKATLQAAVALLNPYADEAMGILQGSVEAFDSLTSEIEGLDAAYGCIGDVDAWCQHVNAIADLYALRRDFRMEARCIEILLRILALMPGSQELRCEMLCRLARAYIALGYTGKARHVLEVAHLDLCNAQVSSTTHIRWHLTDAECYVVAHEHDACRQAIQKAMEHSVQGDEESFMSRTFAHPSSNLNVKERRLVARAAYTSGMLELETGQLASALRFCMIAKCMLFKLWSSLEQIMPRHLTSSTAPDACLSSDDASAMGDSQPTIVTRSYSRLATVHLRELVPDLVDIAMLELKIHSFRGAYHEAFAALKHANKISNYVGAGVAALCDIAAANLYSRSLPLNSLSARKDKIHEARTRIEMVDESLLSTTNATDLLAFGVVKARLLYLEEEPEDQQLQLQSTMEQLKSLLAAQKHHSIPMMLESQTKDDITLVEQMASLQLEKQPNTARTRKAKTEIAKPVKKSSNARSNLTSTRQATRPDHSSCVPLEEWQAELLQSSALASLDYHVEPDIVALSKSLEIARTKVHSNNATLSHSIASAYLLLHQAFEQMSADITFNAVHESIVITPAAQRFSNCTTQQKQAVVRSKGTRRTKETKSVKTIDVGVEPAKPPFITFLHDAYQTLQGAWIRSWSKSSVANTREHSELVSRVSLTASVCTPQRSMEWTHPLINALYNEAPGIHMQRVNQTIEHPHVEKISKTDLSTWPRIEAEINGQVHETLDKDAFQKEFIDIIPSNWNVVSMSLTDQNSAMKLVRYRSRLPPITLRIPFAHQECEDPDEEVLDMSTAYERLRTIIKQHEFTPIDAEIADRAEFKRNWWQKKHELDADLRVLLQDVEDRWFSAVKGAFSSQRCDPEALSNFQAQLQNLLRQQCPAKKGKGKGTSPPLSWNLETHVLELFVGLGNPSNVVELASEDGLTTEVRAETTAMCNGIHDLVRLILENLQFSGESIAIDEVDIDEIIVKVIDALKDYYAAISEEQSPYQHTVLVLDKQLHGFPWESLPCLRNQSVSRLPSLADLRDRIIAARLVGTDQRLQGKIVRRSSGVSLLNPSGDLPKTAQRFQPWLNRLPPTWVHLRKSPGDEGWQEMLSENDIFLYVGHGSTAQYVRPRVVKRLGYQELDGRDMNCAVSWLIGCSSVALEDLGEFEPNGMVLSYLSAGSPAVLGALWDVGDIDADHLSITAADYWGLWDESNKGLDAKVFPARKKIGEEKKALGRPMSMCEAVSRSRDGCKLPYLNGAAFVVYGIPVFLG